MGFVLTGAGVVTLSSISFVPSLLESFSMQQFPSPGQNAFVSISSQSKANNPDTHRPLQAFCPVSDGDNVVVDIVTTFFDGLGLLFLGGSAVGTRSR